MANEAPQKGTLEPITFGEKILTVKRKCSCGGDVEIKKNEQGENVARCLVCGASLTWGGPAAEKK